MVPSTADMTHTGFTQQAFDAFLESRNEPGWLVDQRRSAWKTFCDKPMPTRGEEEWLRTDIRLFKLDKFNLPINGIAHSEATEPLLTSGISLGGHCASLNSHPIRSHIEPKWEKQGVVFGSLDRLVDQHGELIQRCLLQRTIAPDHDKFSALQAACWSGGTLLYVPRGVVVDEPFHAFSMLTNQAVDLGHVIVVMEEDSEATLLCESTSAGDVAGGLHCGAVELILGPRSRLRFVELQNWDHRVWHFAHQKAVVQRDASIQWTIGALGGRLAKVNQTVSLVGEGAQSQVNGTMFTEGTQQLSYHTLQHHEAPSCRSDFLYKAALQDKSRTVWRGMIKVDKEAQKTDGYQRNDNLLLSSRARADSIPGLEIEADDVRCTHGSTTGRVDDELVFYAQSRGYTRKEAIRMIVTGFFQQIFDRITIDSVRQALGQAIARRVRDYD